VRVFSLGYQHHTPASLVEQLQAHGIALLVDVRDLPLSRKKGFSKTPLKAAIEAAGLAYLNLRDLGAPREVRQGKAAGWEVGKFRAAYARHLARQEAAIMELEHEAHERPTAILCLEDDPEECHRWVLSQRLEGDGFEVVHLRHPQLDAGARGPSG
jgi:uncharacterized protein (DUF488 family)